MAGAKTRFGFVGGSEPPQDEHPQSARTVYGRDVHLQMPADFVAPQPPVSPTPLPPSPPAAFPPLPVVASAIPVAVPEVATSRHPSRPRQSRLARFLGQWTRSGRFESRSRLGLDGHPVGELGDDLDVPRDTTARNVVVVLLVAALAFGVTFALVKLRQRSAVTPPAPAAAALPSAVPAAPAPAPVPPAVQPAPAPPTAATPAAAVHQSPKGLGAAAPPATNRRPAARNPHAAGPPEHLKGEILPLER